MTRAEKELKVTVVVVVIIVVVVVTVVVIIVVVVVVVIVMLQSHTINHQPYTYTLNPTINAQAAAGHRFPRIKWPNR